MKRRSVAKLLGLGLIGGAAAVSSDEVSINRDDLIDRDADAAATEIGTQASTPGPDDIDVDKGKIRAPPTPFAYDYQPVDEAVSDGAYVRAVRARPADGITGDRIQLALTDGTDPEMYAARLRLGLAVGSELTSEVTIDGHTVRFAGGTVGEHTALVGDRAGSPDVVLLARATSRRNVLSLIDNWSL